MLDITKCEGTNCSQRDKCFRFISEPERLQSYSAFWETRSDEKCDYYWEVDNGGKRNSSRTSKAV